VDTNLWQPSASIETLQQRAKALADIRFFFNERDVMEVDAPVLSMAAVSDPFIDSMVVNYQHHPDSDIHPYYLQSSPEYAMKRLLAAGSGCIYQMAKVFRNGEVGRKHNPEFTMLEWYRLGFNERDLMGEVSELVSSITGIDTFNGYTYQAVFEKYLGVDIVSATTAQLGEIMNQHVEVSGEYDRDGWLNLLMSHCIEPQLKGAVFIYDYPASQAALARVKQDEQGNTVAARFELFVNGVELANGYHELTDSSEQQRRFEQDINDRKALDLPQRPYDKRLVKALENGLPDCAGVALGVDRLLMLALNKSEISEVIPFDFSRA
jgi:lysyl-tRNA synthetase class 2